MRYSWVEACGACSSSICRSGIFRSICCSVRLGHAFECDVIGLARSQQRNRLHATARRAWIACELGLIHLFSQKVSDGHYRYIAVRACCGLTPRDIRSRLRNADANPTPQRPNSIQEQ